MILDLFRLDGRVALVTGAGRGLGQAMAVGLAQAGANIVSVARSTDAPETRALVEEAGRQFWHVSADLQEASQRSGLVDRVVQETGRLDILVNNAGITGRRPPEDYPLEHFTAVLEVHLIAAFDLSQQAARVMLPHGRGKIINIGSVMCFEGGLNIPAYTAAKHALAGLTKSLAVGWAGRGINVNCLCPGYFATELSGSLQRDPVRGQQILDRIPAGRWGTPDELAGLAVFLASDASNYMHGSVIAIDGAWLSR